MSGARSLSLVKRVDLDFSGNLCKEALLLVDVDNDGDNELVAGNVDGELAVFKGKSSKPWRTCDHLGMITCVRAGDVFNIGRNLLVCTTAEGWCYVFDVGNTGQNSKQPLSPVYSQQLAANCKVILLGDVDGDGLCELVTGHTDRTLRLYRWRSQQETADVKVPIDNKDDDKLSSIKEHDKKERVVERGRSAIGKQSGIKRTITKESTGNAEKHNVVAGKDSSQRPAKEGMLSHSGSTESDATSQPSSDQDKMGTKIRGSFTCHNSWTVPYQIGSLVSMKVDGSQYIVASQPGGTFVTLLVSESQEGGTESAKELSVLAVGSRNPAVRNPTLMIAVKQKQPGRQGSMEEGEDALALCTQDDGTVKLLKGHRLIWSTHVDETCKLFALSTFDINGDGNDQVVVCTWDGQTYIIDEHKNIVKFAFGENVMAFLAGSYAVSPGHNSPCLVYVTFSNRVVIHWDLHASSMPSTNLIGTMNSSFTECRDVVGSLGKMTNSANVDHEMLRKLYAWCLYNGKT